MPKSTAAARIAARVGRDGFFSEGMTGDSTVAQSSLRMMLKKAMTGSQAKTVARAAPNPTAPAVVMPRAIQTPIAESTASSQKMKYQLSADSLRVGRRLAVAALAAGAIRVLSSLASHGAARHPPGRPATAGWRSRR